MTACAKCGFGNPPESKFCASCGAPMPASPNCPSCGTENPAGAKFCKKCGAALLYDTLRNAPQSATSALGGASGSGSGAAARGRVGTSANLMKAKAILWVAVGLYGIGAFLNYSSIQELQMYFGAYANTSGGWLFIMLDAIFGGLSGYAAIEIDRGKTGLAKTAFLANAIVGGLALLPYHQGTALFLNGGGLVLAVYGWLLVSRESRPVI